MIKTFYSRFVGTSLLILGLACGPVSTGLAQDPFLFADIIVGSVSSGPSSLTRVGSELFFFADDGSGVGLWSTDGTAAPALVRGGLSYPFLEPVEFGGKLIFSIDDGSGNGLELWSSDGTLAGTDILKVPLKDRCMLRGAEI